MASNEDTHTDDDWSQDEEETTLVSRREMYDYVDMTVVDMKEMLVDEIKHELLERMGQQHEEIEIKLDRIKRENEDLRRENGELREKLDELERECQREREESASGGELVAAELATWRSAYLEPGIRKVREEVIGEFDGLLQTHLKAYRFTRIPNCPITSSPSRSATVELLPGPSTSMECDASADISQPISAECQQDASVHITTEVDDQQGQLSVADVTQATDRKARHNWEKTPRARNFINSYMESNNPQSLRSSKVKLDLFKEGLSRGLWPDTACWKTLVSNRVNTLCKKSKKVN